MSSTRRSWTSPAPPPDDRTANEWPADEGALAAVQRQLATATPDAWRPAGDVTVAACYVCSDRDPEALHGWAAAVALGPDGVPETVVIEGQLSYPYVPGALALREGPLRAAAVRALPRPPDVLLIDAAGRDHPRGAGLALHLGAVLEVPTVGATDRPLEARGELPADRRGATSPLRRDGEVVAYWLRTRAGTRPIVAHAGWRTTPQVAVEILLRDRSDYRTPALLRAARTAARAARAAATSAGSGGVRGRPVGRREADR